MNEIEKILDKCIPALKYYKYNIKTVFRDEFKDLKNISIKILKEDRRPEGTWIEAANKIIEQRRLFPIEAYLVLSKELNKGEYLDNINKRIKVVEFNIKLLDLLINEISFNISGNEIKKILGYIIGDSSADYKKRLIIDKCKKLRKYSNKSIKNDSVLGVKINNINKIEVVNYYIDYENYYYLPNEEIEFFDFISGEKIIKIGEKKEVFSIERSFNDFANVLFNTKNLLDLNSPSQRVLLYEISKHISKDKNLHLIKSNEKNQIIHTILNNKDLFCEEYYNLIESNYKKTIVDKYIHELELNPTINKLNNIIDLSTEVDHIFEIVKVASVIISDEIPIDTYVRAILKCGKIDKNNIKVALFCEELLIDKPVIMEGIIDILIDMYNGNIFTQNTIKILEYLKCTGVNNNSIEETILKLNAKMNCIDSDYINRFIKAYDNTYHKNSLDDIINMLINIEFQEFNDKLINIFYSFYSRNEDIRALNRLCRNIYNSKLSFKETPIKAKDILKLLNLGHTLTINEDYKYICTLMSNYIKNKKVQEYAQDYLVSILEKNDSNINKVVNEEFKELVNRFKDSNEVINTHYINFITEKGIVGKITDPNEIDDLIKVISNEKLNLEVYFINTILMIVVKYFISINEYDEAIKYIQIYIDKYSIEDDGKFFKQILSNQYKNIDFIESLIYNVNFDKVKKVDVLLNLIAEQLFINKRYDLILEIIRYFQLNKKYIESLNVITKYLKLVDEIHELTYLLYIKEILIGLEEEKRKEIYNLIISRIDCPIELRIEFYDLNPSVENKNFIIAAFENKETKSSLAKRLALEKYFNNNNQFVKISTYGDNDDKCIQIIRNKIILEVEQNIKFVEKVLIEDIIKYDSILKELKELIENYNDTLFEIDKRLLFGKYKIIDKETWELCEKVQLQNIFDSNDIKKGLLFKDYTLINILKSYYDEKTINYNKLGDEVFEILEIDRPINEVIDFNKFLNNFVDILKLQVRLQSNNLLMLNFKKDAFIVNEKGFIPNTHTTFAEYEGEFVCKNKEIFNNKLNIKNKRGNIIVNEKNMVEVIKAYMGSLLLTLDISDEQLVIKQKFIDKILYNLDINSYEEFIRQVKEFIEESKRAFQDISYKQQIKNYYDLSVEEKENVINSIITRKDITDIAKKIVLSAEVNIKEMELKDEYYLYLIYCFNNSSRELSKEKMTDLYDNIIEAMDYINSDTLNDNEVEGINLFINAIDKTSYRKVDIKNDLLKSRLNDKTKDNIIWKFN